MPKNHNIVTLRLYLVRDQAADRAIAVSDGTTHKRIHPVTGKENDALIWHWLPRSQVEVTQTGKTETIDGRSYPIAEIDMPDWLAEREGIEDAAI